ncbi:hypothetical protein RHMOL_Rhmol13G0096400 [Rhododendron molle]|uniref:Uncharacterized protein n=1 Tax=Rhododendron molle TaxID=49168 RepID=A0ACC0L6B3_RHOML|nr:hypothetical protein RHMOL_Rhmol13G0096400 [Rhododendron molle]
MAKRELSSTLKNLKFMQRAALREDKCEKEEEVVPVANFPSSGALKKCTVILEGDPHPGAMKGRMSFQSFNPSIDRSDSNAHGRLVEGVKRKGGFGHVRREPIDTTVKIRDKVNINRNDRDRGRENGSTNYESENLKPNSVNNDENGELKRKQPGVDSSNRLQKNVQGDEEASPSDSRSSYRKPKREKLDWSVLRPPKGRKERE